MHHMFVKAPFMRLCQHIAALCVLGGVVPGLTSLAAAQAYPSRTITLIVPTAAGGGNDVLARIVGQKMSAILGQSIVVLNKPGAQGAIASNYVVQQPADGYTIMLGYIGTHGINPALQTVKYDPVKDFDAIGMVAESPTLMVVSKTIGVNNVDDLIAYGKANPNKLSFASAGVGTAPSVAGMLFNQATGLDMLDVGYKGSAPALMSVLAGENHVMFPSLFSAYPHVGGEKIQALAVAGSQRSPALPDLPTLAELGISGVDAGQWYGIFGPKDMPKPIVTQLNAALNQVLSDAEVIEKITAQGAQIRQSSPEELTQFVIREQKRWRDFAATLPQSAS